MLRKKHILPVAQKRGFAQKCGRLPINAPNYLAKSFLALPI
jgi:hypothetical protein